MKKKKLKKKTSKKKLVKKRKTSEKWTQEKLVKILKISEKKRNTEKTTGTISGKKETPMKKKDKNNRHRGQ